MRGIIHILQIKLEQERKSVHSNLWKFSTLLFFMAFISVYSSFMLDEKLVQKHKNDKYLQQLKSSFVANKKKVNDLKSDLINNMKKKPFEFVEPKTDDIIIIRSE